MRSFDFSDDASDFQNLSRLIFQMILGSLSKVVFEQPSFVHMANRPNSHMTYSLSITSCILPFLASRWEKTHCRSPWENRQWQKFDRKQNHWEALL